MMPMRRSPASSNGWHDEIADTLTLARLRELRDAGGYNREIVLQYAEMNERFHSIRALEKLLDRFEKLSQTTPA